MRDQIELVSLKHKNSEDYKKAERFGEKTAEKALHFHSSFSEYHVTPLAELSSLAKSLGVKGFHVKDESFRFGLNAFKVLGGSYSIGNIIAQRLGEDIDSLSYATMVDEKTREKLGDLTFVTATDGNHGRGVAWTANRLKQKSVVFMPKGSAKERLENIAALGADASITQWNYDDAVRHANECAQKYGWIMVQDTAWEGYEDIPGWIMEGYTTMALEAVRQLKETRPTHVFLQAGVGALAGAVTGFMAAYFKEQKPIITIVEPHQADCIFKSAAANDGRPHFVTGDMDTIMAGLACGEPCTIGWDILKTYADHFLSVDDSLAAKGMRILGNPLRGDDRVISGESGAVTTGVAYEIISNPQYKNIKEALGINETSEILCFSTEGDTDRENYRNIVWNGAYPTKE